MVWLLFATPLERADTSEATGLPIYAPPLYSTDRVCVDLTHINMKKLRAVPSHTSPKGSGLVFYSIGHRDAAVFEGFATQQLQINLMLHLVKDRNPRAQQNRMDVETDLIN